MIKSINDEKQPEFSNLQVRRSERRAAKRMRDLELEGKKLNIKEVTQEDVKIEMSISAIFNEISELFDDLEDYFLRNEYRPLTDVRKFRMKIFMPVEVIEDEKESSV